MVEPDEHNSGMEVQGHHWISRGQYSGGDTRMKGDDATRIGDTVARGVASGGACRK